MKNWHVLVGLTSLVGLESFVGFGPALAQSIPVPTSPSLNREGQPPSAQPLPEPAPTPLPPPEQLLPAPTLPVTPEDGIPTDGPDTITVTQFQVVGSTVFSPAQLAKATESFVGRPITISELFQARSAVTKLYVDNGYVTSGAYIPPQKLKGGVVEIRVLEGSLEEIRVTGLRRLNPNYVRSRLALAARKPLNRKRLLEGLQLLQIDPQIQTLSAELSTGTKPGESLLDVKVAEADTFSGQIALDNGRSPSVGTFRRKVQISEGNLFGQGDGFSVSYSNTQGSNAWDLSYTLPLNARNGKLSFNYGTSNSNVIEKPFNVLDIQSASDYYELTLRQPIHQSPTEEFAIGITGSRRFSQASLLGGEIPFPSVGADDDGGTRVTALRFFQEWTKRSNRQVLAARSQFSLGLDALGSTTNAESPDSRFVSWRGQAQWVRLLAPDTLLLVRGDLQFADRPLVGLEQFSIGGQDSVRGYRQDVLLGDAGLLASAEARFPLVRFPKIKGLLQLTPFIETGSVWNRGDRENPDPNSLWSVGLGLRFQLDDKLTARLDWGIPLTKLKGEKNTLQEDGIYFSIIANPF